MWFEVSEIGQNSSQSLTLKNYRTKAAAVKIFGPKMKSTKTTRAVVRKAQKDEKLLSLLHTWYPKELQFMKLAAKVVVVP